MVLVNALPLVAKDGTGTICNVINVIRLRSEMTKMMAHIIDVVYFDHLTKSGCRPVEVALMGESAKSLLSAMFSAFPSTRKQEDGQGQQLCQSRVHCEEAPAQSTTCGFGTRLRDIRLAQGTAGIEIEIEEEPRAGDVQRQHGREDVQLRVQSLCQGDVYPVREFLLNLNAGSKTLPPTWSQGCGRNRLAICEREVDHRGQADVR